MKNSNDTIGNRTRYLPACSAVPQPTALRCAPLHGAQIWSVSKSAGGTTLLSDSKALWVFMLSQLCGGGVNSSAMRRFGTG